MRVFCLAAMLFLALRALAYPVTTESTPFAGSILLRPTTGVTRASIMLLHGSEGGFARFLDPEASVLASLGYRVLVFCYFDCDRGLIGPRATLKDVSIEHVLDALAWLRSGAPSLKAGVYGFSRGAELTMILGARYRDAHDKPDFLIAHAPSDVYVGWNNWVWNDPACWICKSADVCPDNAPFDAYRWNLACGPDDPNKVDGTKSAWTWAGSTITAGERIAIERFDGPILITVGEKDIVWPSAQTHRLEATLRAAGRSPEVVYFADGDHHLSGADEMRRKDLVLDFLARVTTP